MIPNRSQGGTFVEVWCPNSKELFSIYKKLTSNIFSIGPFFA